jgi:formiminotetrahydrofolate cyclodeaminase
MIKGMSLQDFLDALAGKASTPGGGSAAAVMGAMGAALVSMVAHFTIGKKGYEAAAAESTELLRRAEDLRARLTDMIRADVEAFDRVMAAYGLPKDSDAEKTQRTAAIQAALKSAADVPLACAELCVQVMELTRPMAAIGNKNVISDAGVAVLAAEAALRAAALNVCVNIGAIRDDDWVADRRDRIERLLDGSDRLTEEVYRVVRGRL